ncbi:MAG: hypothetical protein A2W99_04980 [Bacteroidetes bacterium GWF2_33_16]|nr:MAG: hypothetical protein A2X00_17500 [Bacteroidetes bacterium GWE2_32_14]OFY06020.1 MAG: hypothetical protein A2W99_04980 [Bacteroidetes bacterium GWF2_33_16]
MKKTLFRLFFLFAVFSFTFVSCEDDEEKEDSLYVKFINMPESGFTITGIRLLNMGEAGVHEDPVGEFGDNILKNGATIVPGEHKFFTLNIPSLYYAYYRLTVYNGEGVQVYLYDQEGYEASWDGPITHWGSDERQVEVTLGIDDITGNIVVKSWAEWSWIEE